LPPGYGVVGLEGSAALAGLDYARRDSAPWPLPAVTIKPCPGSSFDRPERRPEWDALAAAAAEPNPFYESWYLLPSLRALDPARECLVMRYAEGAALAGLLPLVRQNRYYGRPIPHLSAWVHANCFLGAPLVAAGHERGFWEALLAWADTNAGRALFLHLPQLPLNGPLHSALIAICASQSRQTALVYREDRAMLASDQTPEAYFEATLSAKKRKELRRQSARLAELGAVTFTRSLDTDGLVRWTDQFLALEHSGWKGAAGSALASHHATTTLFREALAGAAALGKLERLTLSLDGEPIAMLASFHAAPGAFSYKTAFDERFARYSPGVLLQRENLAVLSHPQVRWTDSCASADHPMIDHIWRERRAIGRVSVAIGGKARRAAFALLARAETRRNPAGLQL
jgi:CelD/BcsL family acetyltransferase involved in cellulose biosynthesis